MVPTTPPRSPPLRSPGRLARCSDADRATTLSSRWQEWQRGPQQFVPSTSGSQRAEDWRTPEAGLSQSQAEAKRPAPMFLRGASRRIQDTAREILGRVKEKLRALNNQGIGVVCAGQRPGCGVLRGADSSPLSTDPNSPASSDSPRHRGRLLSRFHWIGVRLAALVEDRFRSQMNFFEAFTKLNEIWRFHRMSPAGIGRAAQPHRARLEVPSRPQRRGSWGLRQRRGRSLRRSVCVVDRIPAGFLFRV